MTIDFSKPLDMSRFDQDNGPSKQDIERFLAGIQGNILKGHARKHAAHLLLWFDDTPKNLRRFLAKLARDKVSTAYSQRCEYEEQAAEDPARRHYGKPFCSILLSYRGYNKLDVPEECIPHDPLFYLGMRGKDQNIYRVDPAEVDEHWHWEFKPKNEEQDPRPDAMIILAHDVLYDLKDEFKRLRSSIRVRESGGAPDSNGKSEVVWCSRVLELPGQRVERDFDDAPDKNGKRDSIAQQNAPTRKTKRRWVEHFGFRDDLSQPILLVKDQRERDEIEQARVQPSRWNPCAPLSMVLAKEPWQHESYGSFVAFQKIRQNVTVFHSAMKEAAKNQEEEAYGFKPWEWAAANIVGRLPDGTMIGFARERLEDLKKNGGNPKDAISPTAHYPRLKYSHFQLANDDAGKWCPFGSHVRKMNPRGELTRDHPYYSNEKTERDLRVVRRGIPYEGSSVDGLPEDGLLTPAIQRRGQLGPNPDVGLLFFSYQSKLMHFAFRQWSARYRDFVRPGAGLDEVLATEKDKEAFTTVQGGEYFFAPSLRFLKELDNP